MRQSNAFGNTFERKADREDRREIESEQNVAWRYAEEHGVNRMKRNASGKCVSKLARSRVT
jgi:hypothetical protein